MSGCPGPPKWSRSSGNGVPLTPLGDVLPQVLGVLVPGPEKHDLLLGGAQLVGVSLVHTCLSAAQFKVINLNRSPFLKLSGTRFIIFKCERLTRQLGTIPIKVRLLFLSSRPTARIEAALQHSICNQHRGRKAPRRSLLPPRKLAADNATCPRPLRTSMPRSRASRERSRNKCAGRHKHSRPSPPRLHSGLSMPALAPQAPPGWSSLRTRR